VRKGDAVANSLFNIELEIGIRRSKVEILGNIFDKCSHIMAYADDVIVMGIRLQDV
jgi:sorting nexin-29